MPDVANSTKCTVRTVFWWTAISTNLPCILSASQWFWRYADIMSTNKMSYAWNISKRRLLKHFNGVSTQMLIVFERVLHLDLKKDNIFLLIDKNNVKNYEKKLEYIPYFHEYLTDMYRKSIVKPYETKYLTDVARFFSVLLEVM